MYVYFAQDVREITCTPSYLIDFGTEPSKNTAKLLCHQMNSCFSQSANQSGTLLEKMLSCLYFKLLNSPQHHHQHLKQRKRDDLNLYPFWNTLLLHMNHVFGH